MPDLDSYCTAIGHALEVKNVSIWLITEDHTRVRIEAGTGYFKEQLAQRVCYQMGHGLTGWIAQGGRDADDGFRVREFMGNMSDVRCHRRTALLSENCAWRAEDPEPTALLAVPIYSPSTRRSIGLIKAEGIRKPFTPVDRSWLRVQALRLAFELEEQRTLPFRLFLSHSHLDEAEVGELQRKLQNRGVRCFLSPEDIPVGSDWHDWADSAISSGTHFLFYATANALSSEPVRYEVAKARSHVPSGGPVPLIVCKDVLPSELPAAIRDIHTLQPFRNSDETLEEILSAIARCNSFDDAEPWPAEPRQLGIPPTAKLLGRQEEFAECRRGMQEPGPSVLTITGEGGIGKTELAAHLAQACTAHATVRWVDAGTARTLRELATEIAVALGSHETEEPDWPVDGRDIDAQVGKLAAMGPPCETWIFLDDIRQPMDNVDRFISRLAERTSNRRFVVTSRKTLGINHEYVVELGGLSETDAMQILFGVDGIPSAPPNPNLTQLRADLHGNPYWLRIAGRLLRAGCSDIPSGGKKDVLRIVVTQLKSRVGNLEKVLAACIFFPKSATPESVDAVLACTGSSTALRQLAEESLLQQRGVRYMVHDEARDQLSESLPGLEALRSTMLERYAAYLQGLIDEGPVGNLEQEYENIVVFLDRCRESVDRTAQRCFVRLTLVMSERWRIRGFWRDAQGYAGRALELAKADNPIEEQLNLMSILIQVASDRGQIEAVPTLFSQATTMYETSKSTGRAPIHLAYARILYEYGRYIDNNIYHKECNVSTTVWGGPSPEAFFIDSYDLFKKHDSTGRCIIDAARARQAHGFRRSKCKNWGRAISLICESLEDALHEHDLSLQGRCLYQLGRIAGKQKGAAYDEILQERFSVWEAENPELRRPRDGPLPERLLRASLACAQITRDPRAESRSRLALGNCLLKRAKQPDLVWKIKSELLREAREMFLASEHLATRIDHADGLEEIRQALREYESSLTD